MPFFVIRFGPCVLSTLLFQPATSTSGPPVGEVPIAAPAAVPAARAATHAEPSAPTATESKKRARKDSSDAPEALSPKARACQNVATTLVGSPTGKELFLTKLRTTNSVSSQRDLTKIGAHTVSLYELFIAVMSAGGADMVWCTVGYLSFGPIEKILCFCDLSVREKDWRGKPGL